MPEPSNKDARRRLAAILTLDFVGFSAAMAANEALALNQLLVRRDKIVKPIVLRQGGRIVKTTGDGVLADFQTSTDAVVGAVHIQEALGQSGDGLQVRIGIHVGEVTEWEGDIYGDALNIAFRLEQNAPPGGIWMSRAVYEQVRGRADFAVSCIGERIFKNLPEPILVYTVDSPGDIGLSKADLARRTGSLQVMLSRPAIAVLPFASLTSEGDVDYFTNGITEDIATALACWRWFPVIASNALAPFEGDALDLQEIGRQLGARYLLRGSVRKAASRVRLNVQLIDAPSGHQLWAARFDRDNTDIFALQDEISTAIVTQLEPQLRDAEQRRALRKRPDDLDAWDRCQQGLWHQRKMTAKSFATACRHFDEAIQIDPNFAYAHSMRALCLWHRALSGWTSDPPGFLGATMASAMRAIEIDSDDWLAHAISGIAHLYTAQRHDLAAKALARALDLNPSAAMAHHLQGCVLMYAGEHEAAIVSQDATLRLDPTYPYSVVVLADKAMSQIGLGSIETALETLEEAQNRQPGNLRVLQRYVYALALHGELERAKAEGARLLTLQSDLGHAYIEATYPFRVDRERNEFLDALAAAGVLERPRANGIEHSEHSLQACSTIDDGLTARELEVLRLMAIGRSNQDIATALGITLNTVATHVRSILAKTFSVNRTEAAAYAVRQKIVSGLN